MKVNILTTSKRSSEKTFSGTASKNLLCTRKHREGNKRSCRTVHLDNKTAGDNICVIKINSPGLPCLRGSQSSTNSLKRQRQLIESVDQKEKICERNNFSEA